MIELEALNWSFQLLFYIYDMISGMSRADVKILSWTIGVRTEEKADYIFKVSALSSGLHTGFHQLNQGASV